MDPKCSFDDCFSEKMSPLTCLCISLVGFVVSVLIGQCNPMLAAPPAVCRGLPVCYTVVIHMMLGYLAVHDFQGLRGHAQ